MSETGAVLRPPTDGVFVYVGHCRTISFLIGKLAMDEEGYLVTDKLMRTSVPGIFAAAGEIQDHRFKQAATSAGQGVAAAMESRVTWRSWNRDQESGDRCQGSVSRPAPDSVPSIIPDPGDSPGAKRLSPENLQAYIRMAAALTHDVVEAPPFVLFFNPTDDLRFYNYGVPVEAVSRLRGGELASLRAVFAAHERLLRFEFIEEAPHRTWRRRLRPLAWQKKGVTRCWSAPRTAYGRGRGLGLAIRRLTPESPRADLAAFISVQGQSFGEEDRVEPTDAREVDDLRRRSGQGSHYFLGLWMVRRSLRARRPRPWMASPSWWGSRRWR